ncbi:MAG: YbjN domain-containing protein [Sulfuritalea sp.]|nr:YbjN domain-containing protein [Sulfuritalea sp.]
MANHEDQANTTVSTGHLEITHFAQVADYLDRHEWACTLNEEQGLFFLDLSSAAATYRMYIKVSYTKSICNIMVISALPVKAPADRRSAIAESLQRINFTLMQGTAELDFSNGEIRFRTLVTTEGASLTDTLLDYVVGDSFELANRYTAPLLAVAFGNAAPDSVLDMAQVPVATTLQ